VEPCIWRIQPQRQESYANASYPQSGHICTLLYKDESLVQHHDEALLLTSVCSSTNFVQKQKTKKTAAFSSVSKVDSPTVTLPVSPHCPPCSEEADNSASVHSSSSKVSDLKKIFEPTHFGTRVNSSSVAQPVSRHCPPGSSEADKFDYGNPHIPKHQSTASCSKIGEEASKKSDSCYQPFQAVIICCVSRGHFTSHYSYLVNHLYGFLFMPSPNEHTLSVRPPQNFPPPTLSSELLNSACPDSNSLCTSRDSSSSVAPAVTAIGFNGLSPTHGYNDHFPNDL